MDCCYKMKSLEQLKKYPHTQIQEMDWYEDFDKIDAYYREAFGIDDLQKDDEEDPFHVVRVIAYMLDGKIVSFAAVLDGIREGELEIGAVSTDSNDRNRGYCKSVISYACKYILKRGLIASLTTREHNIPMQKAAEAI